MITIVVGTRPEIIKTAPVIRALEARNERVRLIHTGQHSSHGMTEVFFEELALARPQLSLDAHRVPREEMRPWITRELQRVFADGPPRWVLVQGDTHTAAAGALAAKAAGLPLAHLEAGLRSDDPSMPEEENRILADRAATLRLCPTPLQAARLQREGLTDGVVVVGNTVVDASMSFAERARSESQILQRAGLGERPHALLTLHRGSNVDDLPRLEALLEGVAALAKAEDWDLVFPVHPRTAQRISERGLESVVARRPFVRLEPLGYLDLLRVLGTARLVLTDSGGVQEEACILRVPCVTLRANTERPETVAVGANLLCASADPAAIAQAARSMQKVRTDWVQPLGDGRTGPRVAELLRAR